MGRGRVKGREMESPEPAKEYGVPETESCARESDMQKRDLFSRGIRQYVLSYALRIYILSKHMLYTSIYLSCHGCIHLRPL